jgi:hypothetical protein
MSIYKINWEILAGELLNRLSILSEINNNSSLERFRPILAKILLSSGGLPFSDHDFDTEERSEFGIRILHDAIKHVLTIDTDIDESTKYILKQSQFGQIESRVEEIEGIDINCANKTRLMELPGIGDQLANRIIEERTTKGFFLSIKDLMDRVEGLGPIKVENLKPSIIIKNPKYPKPYKHLGEDFDQDFLELLERCKGDSQEDRLSIALNWLAVSCAREPNPVTKLLIPYQIGIHEEVKIESEWVGFLEGEEYYEVLPDLLSTATSSIDVCMFHIVLPSEEHPTRRLLDTLIDMQTRDIKVRVIMDSDRKDDPYNSTIINTPAKEYLEGHGIACRFDETDRLLHSKYIIIDSSVVVIGSHNWSSGSYFEFNDISLAVWSPIYAQTMTERFQNLWDRSS